MSHSKHIVHPWHPRKDGSMVVVIPKDIKERLGIVSGDTLFVRMDGHNLIYTKI